MKSIPVPGTIAGTPVLNNTVYSGGCAVSPGSGFFCGLNFIFLGNGDTAAPVENIICKHGLCSHSSTNHTQPRSQREKTNNDIVTSRLFSSCISLEKNKQPPENVHPIEEKKGPCSSFFVLKTC